MPQVFSRAANTWFRVVIIGAVISAAGAVGAALWLQRSDYITQVGVAKTQPIQFSHDHHVRGIGIDCRYCHSTVEDGPFAGIPASETCMNCHKIIWNTAPILEPVRQSAATGKPLEWVRIHDLPDFVYFNHSIHVSRGVGCSTCHGQVDQMPLMRQVSSLQMEWCLNCHRDPAPNLRPKSEITNMAWKPSPEQEAIARATIADAHSQIESPQACSYCHR